MRPSEKQSYVDKVNRMGTDQLRIALLREADLRWQAEQRIPNGRSPATRRHRDAK